MYFDVIWVLNWCELLEMVLEEVIEEVLQQVLEQVLDDK